MFWDVIFPRAGTEEELNPPSIFEDYDRSIDKLDAMAGDADAAKTALAESRQLFADQDSRAEHLNSRAMSMVGHSGLIGSIAFGLIAWTSTTLAKDSAMSLVAIAATITLIAISLAYLSYGLIAAFGAIGRHISAAMDPNDLPKQDEAGSYDLQLAKGTLGYLVCNYQTNNRKAELVLVAQERIRNGLVVFVLGAVVAISGQVVSNRSDDLLLDTASIELDVQLAELKRTFGDVLVATDESTAARFADRGVSVYTLPTQTIADIPFAVLLLVDESTKRLQEVRFESAYASADAGTKVVDAARSDATTFVSLEAALVRSYGTPEKSLERSEPHPIRVWLTGSKTVWVEDRSKFRSTDGLARPRFVVGFRKPDEWESQLFGH